MNIPLSFFLDEVRNKFYISTQLKQAWAAELMVLSEVDRVCRKHGIRYFADWGTMLGAIRHGGFVPWDDDLDICMTRDQYEKFVNEAAKDLPEDYWVMNYASDKDHWHFVAGVANRMELFGLDKENMEKYNNYLYTANIDIFIMDYLYIEEVKEQERREELFHLMAIAKSIIKKTFSIEQIQYYLCEIEKKYGVHISYDTDHRRMGVEIYRLIERVMSRVKPEDSNEVGEVDMWILRGHKGYPKSYYENAVRLPFEFTDIPVQYKYNQVMKRHYGNYLEVHKAASLHDYPSYMSQENKLKELLGVNKLTEFEFDESRIERFLSNDGKERGGSLKTISLECLGQMELWHQEVERQIVENQEDVAGILADCQQLAVDFGTLAERIKGEGNSVTLALEHYCESLFRLYEIVSHQGKEKSEISDSTNEMLKNSLRSWKSDFDLVKGVVQTNIIDRTSIVFFPVYHERWSGFQTLYEKVIQEDNCDVYVVPLPLIKKDSEGRLTEDMLYDLEGYPSEIHICSYAEFNLALCCPDKIYIQDTYDNENPLFSVPREFYSSILRENCGKLLYIPWFEIDDFERGAVCETFNISIMLNTPGFMNADEVWAQSENMRQRYIEILTEYARTQGRCGRKK